MEEAPVISTSVLNLPLRAQFSSTLLINDHDLITGAYGGSIDVTPLTKDTGIVQQLVPLTSHILVHVMEFLYTCTGTCILQVKVKIVPCMMYL